MPSEENNGYDFPILNGIATFMQGAIAVFTKASEWYRDNEENIKNFLTSTVEGRNLDIDALPDDLLLDDM